MPSILKGKNTIPIKFKIGFWATFTSTILDKLLEVLQMKGVVIPPTLLDLSFYMLIGLLVFGLVMLVLGIIEWVGKSRGQKEIIVKQNADITKLEHDIELLRQERAEAIKPDLLEKLKATGRLEDISRGDALWIMGKTILMQTSHGHDDFWGLTADRASGVPLNELMARPCSQCGIPRNQKSKQKG